MAKTDDQLHSIGRVALLIALSVDADEEERLKTKFVQEGYSCAVTGIGGSCEEVKKKINTAVIGACFGNGIISKTPKEIHAVIHAALEAKEGLLLSAPSGGDFAGKAVIVRHGEWIAVAVYGRSAMHVLTNHERVGMGIMHI